MSTEQFKNLDFYIDNEPALKADLKKIDNYFQNFKSDNVERLNFYLHQLSKDISLIKNQQSFSLMSERLHERKMYKLEKISKEIVDSCESVILYPEECSLNIEKFKDSVVKGKLSLEIQKKLLTELDYYSKQQKVLEKYNDDFKESFDSSVVNVNAELGKILPQGQAIVTTKVIHSENAKAHNVDFKYVGAFACLILLTFFVLATWFKVKKRKRFYYDFFEKIVNEKIVVKVYGRISNLFIKKYTHVIKKLLPLFNKELFYSDLSFNLAENKKAYILNVIYHSKHNLSLYYEESQCNFSTELKKIVSEVEQLGGEVIFSAQYENSDLVKSEMTICLPR